MKIKNVILLYCASMVVGLYTTFVLMELWDWFVIPAFHLGAISFWAMYGLILIVSLFRSARGDIETEVRENIVDVMLDACVPDDRREEVREKLKELTERIWYDAGWKVFGQIIGNSITLGIGFVVHGFAS